jgi:hypothetical protein
MLECYISRKKWNSFVVGGSREKSNIVAFPILSYAAMNLVGLFTEPFFFSSKRNK